MNNQLLETNTAKMTKECKTSALTLANAHCLGNTIIDKLLEQGTISGKANCKEVFERYLGSTIVNGELK